MIQIDYLFIMVQKNMLKKWFFWPKHAKDISYNNLMLNEISESVFDLFAKPDIKKESMELFVYLNSCSIW